MILSIGIVVNIQISYKNGVVIPRGQEKKYISKSSLQSLYYKYDYLVKIH